MLKLIPINQKVDAMTSMEMGIKYHAFYEVIWAMVYEDVVSLEIHILCMLLHLR